MFYRSISFLCLLNLLFTIGCISSKNIHHRYVKREMHSSWIESPVTIDGQGTDWAETALYYTKQGRFSVGFQNDKKFIFLLVLTKHRMLIRSMQIEGMTLWFVKNQKRSYGLRFTGRSLDDKTPMTVIVEKKVLRIPSNGSKGPALALLRQRGWYGFEARIPLIKSKTNIYGISEKWPETFQLQIAFTKTIISYKKKGIQSDQMAGRRGSGGRGRRLRKPQNDRKTQKKQKAKISLKKSTLSLKVRLSKAPTLDSSKK